MEFEQMEPTIEPPLTQQTYNQLLKEIWSDLGPNPSEPSDLEVQPIGGKVILENELASCMGDVAEMVEVIESDQNETLSEPMAINGYDEPDAGNGINTSTGDSNGRKQESVGFLFRKTSERPPSTQNTSIARWHIHFELLSKTVDKGRYL